MRNKKKKFSIICATVGRSNQINKLCKSLDNQIYKNFELIICDQNRQNFNLKLKKIYTGIKIIFLKSKIGLSKARNKGVKVAKGDYFLFLDDDVYFNKNFLKNIDKTINKTKADILAYSVVNKHGKFLLNYPKKDTYLNNTSEIFNSISSVSFAIKSNKKIFFDNKIGLGSKSIYQSGEETDYILKAIRNFNFKVYFKRNIYLFHEIKQVSLLTEIKKNFFYGCGWSYVVKKNNFHISFVIKNIFKLILNFIFNFLTLNFKKTMISISAIFGRTFGLFY